MLVTRNPDDGLKSGQNMLLKN